MITTHIAATLVYAVVALAAIYIIPGGFNWRM